jgi:dipeptidyl aminopeptidase/acylaminoacyl peptidase
MLLSTAAMAADAPKYTMEQIMANPDWIQRGAEQWYWGDKSEAIYYRQKREGSVLRDLYRQDINGHGAEKVDLDAMHWHADRGAARNNAGTMEAYAYEGNIFLKNVETGVVRQITYTTANERAPQFLNDGRVAYRVGNIFYAFNPENSATKEVANLMTKDAPKGVEEPKSYLAKEEHKLIEWVADQHKKAKDREAQDKDLAKANASIEADPYYFGKDMRIRAASLSPNGDKMIVNVVSNKPRRKKTDIMPNFINSEAIIEAVNVRTRVADQNPVDSKTYYIDLTKHSKTQLSYKYLPDYNKDVLKSVRQENYKAQGKKYKSKKNPRPINLMFSRENISWNNQGTQVALMLKAWDNKDRWIATVDFEKGNLVSQDKDHNDAWVNNRAYAEMLWSKTGDTIYYLSEDSGYSQLYSRKLGGKEKRLTQGDYVVSDLQLSHDGKSIFYRANKTHPGNFEVYRVDVDSGDTRIITNLGGMNSYVLSPDSSKLLIQHSTTTMPPELFVVDMVIHEAKQMTRTVTDKFLSMKFKAPRVVAIPSNHGTKPIYSRVYLPDGVSLGENTGPKRKAVMFIHGAGFLQNAHKGWSGYFREFMFNQMLVQQGYVVIDMDWRASRGYGSDWRTAIYRQMGNPELEDMTTGVNWIVENANVDPKRVGAYGGSYGGFLTLIGLFKSPDLFAAGAAQRLVSDWAHYNHGYTSNILNTPVDDPIAYKISSPIYYAENLTKPLLINHGMVDNNVFYHDAVRLVQRLIELKKDNWESAIYPVEPHGFREPSSWLNEYRRVYKLFDKM